MELRTQQGWPGAEAGPLWSLRSGEREGVLTAAGSPPRLSDGPPPRG